MGGNEIEAEPSSLSAEAFFDFGRIWSCGFGEDGRVEWYAVLEDVVVNAGDAMGGGGVCFGRPESGSDAAVVIAQRRVTVAHGLSCEAEGLGRTMRHLASSRGEDLTAGDAVVRTQSKP